MGTLSISKESRLYWLGRYTERVYTTLGMLCKFYDSTIDKEFSFREFCGYLGLPAQYESNEEFCRDLLFNEENPASVISSLNCAYDNAVVLRETLGSSTLAYIQMACNAMALAKESAAPMIEAQWAIDDIMAFRGSCEDRIASEQCRSIIKCGSGVERLDLFLRLQKPVSEIRPVAERMLNTLYKTGLPVNQESLGVVADGVLDDEIVVTRWQLLAAVENLFPGL